jgi:hypothetical protein
VHLIKDTDHTWRPRLMRCPAQLRRHAGLADRSFIARLQKLGCCNFAPREHLQTLQLCQAIEPHVPKPAVPLPGLPVCERLSMGSTCVVLLVIMHVQAAAMRGSKHDTPISEQPSTVRPPWTMWRVNLKLHAPLHLVRDGEERTRELGHV